MPRPFFFAGMGLLPATGLAACLVPVSPKAPNRTLKAGYFLASKTIPTSNAMRRTCGSFMISPTNVFRLSNLPNSIAAVKEKMSQGSLFEVPATPQPAAQTAPAAPATPAPQPATPIPTFHNVVPPQPATAISAPAPVLERSPEAPAVPMTGNNHSTQPVGVPIAPKPTAYNEYDSAPRPADEEYPSYRPGEYSEYLDFAPPVSGAGTGMGAPTLL